MLHEFYGVTEQQLLIWLSEAQMALAKGSTLISFSNDSGSSAVQMNISPAERIIKLQAALYQLDNDRYSIFEHSGANRSTPVFNVSSRAY